MASYSTIIKEVDLSHPIRYMYYPVFLMRRIIFVLSLVLFANMPKVQIAVMCFACVVMIAYVVVIKPQKERVMIILTAAGEAMLLILHLISIAFLDETMKEDTSNKIGWFIIVLVALYIMVNWTVVVVITVINMKQNYKDWKLKKVEVKQKIADDYKYKKWKKRKQLEKK